MRGAKPTPTYLKLLKGNPGRRAVRAEIAPAQPESVPEPPEFLSSFARDEWWRVAPELHRLGLLTVLSTLSPPTPTPVARGAKRSKRSAG
jgi:phage terminase small subunit